jgi:hypothetical protein
MQIAAAMPIVSQNSAETTERRLRVHINTIACQGKRGDNLRLWCLRESQLKTCDDDEGFREGDEDVAGRLNPDVDTLWGRVVDVMLQDGGVDHGE